MSATDSSSGASQSRDIHTVSAQPAKVETYGERSEDDFVHLSQSDLAYYTGLFPRNRKGFRYFLNKIPVVWGRMSRD